MSTETEALERFFDAINRNDMQAMIHHEGGIGIPMFLSSLDGHNKKLKGLQAIPLGGMMASSFAEHVWLEA